MNNFPIHLPNLFLMNKTKWLTLFLLFLLSIGCKEGNKLKKILVDYHTDMSTAFPGWENPGPMKINQADSIEQHITFLEQFTDKLANIDSTKLETTEFQIWKTELETLQAKKQFWENYFRDPSAFDLTPFFINLTGDSPDTLKNLRLITVELEKVPRHFETAKKLLYAPDPGKSAIAVQKQIIFLRFLQIDLPGILKTNRLTQVEQKKLAENIQKAKIASKDYIGFCESLIFEHFDSTIVRPQEE